MRSWCLCVSSAAPGCVEMSVASGESRHPGQDVPWAAGRSSCCRRKALSLKTIACVSGAPQPCVTAACRRWNSCFRVLPLESWKGGKG